MDLLVNDLSIERQFADSASFRAAFGRLMTMRALAKQYGRDIYCHRQISSTQITSTLTFQQLLSEFDRNQRMTVIGWLQQTGPFWEDTRQHGGDDYLDCRDAIVTDTGVGEAAFRTHFGVEHHTVSLTPTDWCHAPLPVRWVRDDQPHALINLYNHWTEAGLRQALENAPSALNSWERVEEIAKARYKRLTFLPACFIPLRGLPFVSAAAARILVLLKILDDFRGCFDTDGKRSEKGHQLYADFFADKGGEGGGRALFTDSSDSEKNDFRKEMIFPHPVPGEDPLFCTWHGKIRASVQMRIHFSWPVSVEADLYIAYVGPKITKY